LWLIFFMRLMLCSLRFSLWWYDEQPSGWLLFHHDNPPPPTQFWDEWRIVNGTHAMTKREHHITCTIFGVRFHSADRYYICYCDGVRLAGRKPEVLEWRVGSPPAPCLVAALIQMSSMFLTDSSLPKVHRSVHLPYSFVYIVLRGCWGKAKNPFAKWSAPENHLWTGYLHIY
jgi:hypothetical protein